MERPKDIDDEAMVRLFTKAVEKTSWDLNAQQQTAAKQLFQRLTRTLDPSLRALNIFRTRFVKEEGQHRKFSEATVEKCERRLEVGRGNPSNVNYRI